MRFILILFALSITVGILVLLLCILEFPDSTIDPETIFNEEFLRFPSFPKEVWEIS